MDPAYDGINFGDRKYDANGNPYLIPYGKDFEIINIQEDIDTNEIIYDTEVSRLGKKNIITIPKKDAMDRQKIMKYSNLGLDVSSSNNNLITAIFQQKEDEYVEKKNTINTAYSIPGMKLTTIKGKQTYVYAGDTFPHTNAKYIGYLDLRSGGSSDEWFKLIKSEVEKSTPIAFIVSASFAPMLLAVLREYVDNDNTLIHMDGLSSTGKSTMICLALSSYGNPSDRIKNGLFRTWNSTNNALLKKCMNVNGLLFGLDEISMASGDMTKTVYSLSSGVEKERLDRSSQLKESESGTYMIISSGESGILSKTNSNIGLSMRVIELANIQWTKDAEHSELIKSVVKKNYGHSAPEFGKKLGDWIIKNSIEALLDSFESWRQYYCDNCSVQERKERMSSRYALILLAADLCNQFFNFNINITELNEFINKNEASTNTERNGYNNCYERIVAYINEHKEHFSTNYVFQNQTYKRKAQEEWGYLEAVDSSIQLDDTFVSYKAWVSLSHFERIVKHLGYEDPKMIRKYLKNQGYTECEDDRDTCRRVFDGTRLTYIVLYLPGGLSEEELIMNKAILPQALRKGERKALLTYLLNEGRKMNQERLKLVRDSLEKQENEMDNSELEKWNLVKSKVDTLLSSKSQLVELLDDDEESIKEVLLAIEKKKKETETSLKTSVAPTTKTSKNTKQQKTPSTQEHKTATKTPIKKKPKQETDNNHTPQEKAKS